MFDGRCRELCSEILGELDERDFEGLVTAKEQQNAGVCGLLQHCESAACSLC